VDSVEQSRQEAGDLIIAFHGDEICWTGVKKLSEIVAGKASGRTSDKKSHFSNQMDCFLGSCCGDAGVCKGEEKGLAGVAVMERPREKLRRRTNRLLREATAQGIVQPGLHIAGQFDRLRSQKNRHRQPGLIDHHLALSTMLQIGARAPAWSADLARRLGNRKFRESRPTIQFVPPCRK